MTGGIALIAVSYFAGTVLAMSLISAVVIAAIHVLLRKGY
jgi:hypothetical protein